MNDELKMVIPAVFRDSYLKKQSVRQGKLVQFSRFESCLAKVSRPAGM